MTRFTIFDTIGWRRNNDKSMLTILFSPFRQEDNLTPEQINQIGYETMKELTSGKFRFIVATHVDKDHLHNHIIIKLG